MRFVGLWWEAALSLPASVSGHRTVFAFSESSGHFRHRWSITERARVHWKRGQEWRIGRRMPAIRWLGMQMSSPARCNKHCNSWPLAHHRLGSSIIASPDDPSWRRSSPVYGQRAARRSFQHGGTNLSDSLMGVEAPVRVTHAAWHFNWFWGAQKSCAKILTVPSVPIPKNTSPKPLAHVLLAPVRGVLPEEGA